MRTPLLVLAALAAAGCAPIRAHNGYVIDADLVSSIQPGVDNRASVERVLGRPSFTGQFGARDWYYVSRDTSRFAFRRPRPTDQTTLHVRFGPDGGVEAIDRSGLELASAIDPSGRTTPTLGRERGFFQELFGNIGTVGAAGPAGAGTGANRN